MSHSEAFEKLFQITHWQQRAGEASWHARACLDQAPLAKRDGFDPEEWLDDAIRYQVQAAATYRAVRLLMEIEK